MYQFKENDSEARLYPLCLGDISKDFTLGNMKKKKKTPPPPNKKKKKKKKIKRNCILFYRLSFY